MATIFAPATGNTRAAIAIIRLSGSGCGAILERLAGPLPPPRRAALRSLRHQNGEVLDQAIVLWFPAPRSYTGEDGAELHVHGGPAVIHAVSDALLAAGARPAERGEFTRRAFLNGRMDLLEAEGVADLIAAQTERQRRQALAQLGGSQSGALAEWADRLRRVLAWQEALIDFPDDDLPASVERELIAELHALSLALRQAAEAGRAGARVRDGIVVAVAGLPNVGKSSIVNRLAARDVAITSPEPGTTRDALEVWIELAGCAVCLVDTAGLRNTADPVEAEGIRRARDRAETADLVLHVADAAMLPGAMPETGLAVANKIDIAGDQPPWLGVSAHTGEGFPALLSALEDAILRLTACGDHPVLSAARHHHALQESAACLERAGHVLLPELRGEEIRLAMQALGRITGQVGVEDVLDVVFRSFCIGK